MAETERMLEQGVEAEEEPEVDAGGLAAAPERAGA